MNDAIFTQPRIHAMPFGALPNPAGGVDFRFWAPDAPQVQLELGTEAHAMARDAEGWHRLRLAQARAGDRYRFRMPDGQQVPDPASRFNPDDVHGPSEVIDPAAYAWRDGGWRGRPWSEAVIYELHVGSFTPEGTFDATRARLPELAALGITAIELMPLADFPGRRGWGYDGVLPFAPDAIYGRPEALKALIDEAHGLGMMVLVDVVYNHFGPEGNYLHACCPQFFNDAHRTPWGAAINYDGPGSATVRDFFIHNALYWVEEFHADGLRMDAVHAIRDDSPVGIVQAICDALREGPGRTREVHVVLEEDRNLAHLLERDKEGRPRIATAQWNDDLHHAAHVLLTGERDGYYADYAQQPLELFARALAEGFVYQGQASVFREGETRGEPSANLPSGAFVSYLQTHDQVGNRAFGERIDALADPVLVRAARACLLLSPHTPMLFMGEEYAAATPFPYFCDFGPELAAAVSQGRRDEFGRFAAFADEAARAAIPDCNAPESFALAKLDWSERERSPHCENLEGVRQLLQLRRERLVPHFGGRQHGGDYDVEDDLLRVRWTLSDGAVLHLLACFGEHQHAVDAPPGETLHSVGALGEAVDAASAPDEHPQRLRLARGAVHLSLQVSDVE
jgi:maltooligosyltrehalose trehalohydrolase